jgi:hypothetical protein
MSIPIYLQRSGLQSLHTCSPIYSTMVKISTTIIYGRWFFKAWLFLHKTHFHMKQSSLLIHSQLHLVDESDPLQVCNKNGQWQFYTKRVGPLQLDMFACVRQLKLIKIISKINLNSFRLNAPFY